MNHGSPFSELVCRKSDYTSEATTVRVMKVSVCSEGQSAPLKDHSSGGVDWLNGFNLWVIWVLGDFRQFGKQNSCCRFSNGDVRYFQNGHFFFFF